MKATFFWISACAAFELPLLLLVLRELRPAESASATRATVGDAGGSATGVFSFSVVGSGTTEPAGVGLADESADEEVLGLRPASSSGCPLESNPRKEGRL